MEDEKIEKEEQVDDGLQHLIDEGEKPDEVKPDEVKLGPDGKPVEEAEVEEDGGVDPADLISRLDSLETKYGEREQEIIFLRGELRKANQREPETRGKPDADEINLDEVVASLTDKDPKVAARKI